MKAAAALLCLGLALASRPPSDINEYKPRNIHQDTSYVPGKLYKYFYDSQLLHEIPTAGNQKSGQRVQAIVEAYAMGPSKMAMRLRSVSFGSINQRLSPDANSRILSTDAFEMAEISEEQKRQLEQPVVFKREHGMVSALEYSRNEPEWCLNLKRSIMSMMSHNLEAHGVQTPKEVYCPRSGECSKAAQQTTENMRYWQAYEMSVEGNCEAAYSLVQNPSGKEESVWNVTKAINLAKCQQSHGSMYNRPEIRYNFHLTDPCPECEYKGKVLNATTLYTINVIGERSNYVIEKAQAVSEYHVPDMSDSSKVTYWAKANQSLVLIEVEQKQAPRPENPGTRFGSGLMYSLNWDALKEKFFMDASPGFLDESPYAKFASEPTIVAMELLKQLAREMAASIPEKAIDQNAPSTFLRLVKVMRLMTESDLDKIHDQAYQNGLSGLSPADQKAAKDLVHAAIGAAGTYSALKHISKCVTENKINQMQAVMAVRQFQSARVVSREALQEVQQMCQQLDAQSKPALKQTCYLTYGSMARTFCMPRENKMAVEQPLNTQARSAQSRSICSTQERQEIVENMHQLFNENPEQWSQQLLALKALGNAGLPESIPKLREIVWKREVPEIVRIEAVKALRGLRSSIPQQVISVCMPIVMDREIEPAIRMAAVDLIMLCNPNLSQMSTLAAQVNRKDDSRSVKSFIYTYLSNMANSTGIPCEKQQSEQARHVIKMISNNEKVITGSFMSTLTQIYGQELSSNYAFANRLISMMSNSSYVPTAAELRGSYNFMGFHSQEGFSWGYAGQSIDKAIISFLSKNMQQEQNRARRSVSDDIRQKLADLTASFESFKPEQSKMFAYMRLNGQDTGFLPLDKPIMQYLRELVSLNSLEGMGENINMNLATMISESMYKIPTVMGFPLVVRTQFPILAQIKGSFGKLQEPGYYVKNMQLTPSMASNYEISFELWSPVLNSGVKTQEKWQETLPLKGSIKKDGHIEMELPSTSERKLVTYISEPLCFVRKWWSAEPNTYVKPVVQKMNPQMTRLVQKKQRSSNILGMQVQYQSWYHPAPYGYNAPLITPAHGPVYYSLSVRKASAGSCNKLSIKLNKPKFQWITSGEAVKIDEFKVQESGSSEEQSTESQDFQASTQSPFYLAKMNVEAECGSKQEVQLKYVESADSRIRKVSADLKVNNQPRYCAQGQVVYPKAPLTPEQATGKTYSRLVYAWNGQCEGSRQAERVQITIQSERSRAKAEMERAYQQQHKQCLTDESPVPCYYIVKQAAQPNKHSIKITYDPNMPVQYKNTTQQLLMNFIGQHWAQSDINQYSHGNDNEIKATIRMDPLTTSRANITIQEPGKKIVMKEVKSCLLNWESALLRQVMKPTSYNAMCTVADSHIESFDKTHFTTPVTDCWSVLAKDCSPENRFAVLMKRNTMGSPQKTLAVITKNQRIEISSNLRLSVNGQQKQLSTEYVTKLSDDLLVQIYPGQKLKVSLPKERIVVYFDGQAAKVGVNAMYFSEQCGLCGHYNRDARDVFRSPLSQQQESIVEFFKQYQIEIPGCQKEPQQPQEYNIGTSYRNLHNNRRQPREIAPIHRHIGQHVEGEYCVTKDKKPVCPHGYSPSQYQKERVTLHCIPDQHEARRVSRLVSHQATDLQLPREFDDSTMVSVRIPSKCKRV